VSLPSQIERTKKSGQINAKEGRKEGRNVVVVLVVVVAPYRQDNPGK
jgi:hypothetical protein